MWTAASLTELERDSAKDPLTFATPAQETAFEVQNLKQLQAMHG